MRESTRSPIRDAVRSTARIVVLVLPLGVIGCDDPSGAPVDPAVPNNTGAAAAINALPLVALSSELAAVVESAEAGDAAAQIVLADLFEGGDGRLRDDAKARVWYRRAAEQGLAEAQYGLGVLLFEGRGGPEEPEVGIEWLQESAAGGHLEAMNSLGIVYSMGRGIPKDSAEAMRWFERAAEGGHLTAQLSLGARFAAGYGAPADAEKAAHWFRAAAEGGLPAAQWRYGLALASGEGVPQDDVEAYVWLSLSGPARSHRAAGDLEDVASRLTQEQRLEARRRMAERVMGRLE